METGNSSYSDIQNDCKESFAVMSDKKLNLKLLITYGVSLPEHREMLEKMSNKKNRSYENEGYKEYMLRRRRKP